MNQKQAKRLRRIESRQMKAIALAEELLIQIAAATVTMKSYISPTVKPTLWQRIKKHFTR